MARKRKDGLRQQGETNEIEQSEAGPASKAPRRRESGRKGKGSGFYADSLDVAEQAQMGEALGMEGLDEEIALLRVRLRRALEEQPEDTEFLLKSIALLAKLLATRYRLSKKAEDDLYENMVGVIKGIGGAIWPEAFGPG